MRIDDFTFTGVDYRPMGANLWQITRDVLIQVNLPAGKGWRFTVKQGFVTNFRSGSDLISPIIPRTGSEGYSLCYVVHDACYTWLGEQASYHCMGKETADGLLKAMLACCDSDTRAQIAELKRLGAKDFKAEIKALEKDILGSFKIWCVWKAVSLFGGGAYMEKNPPPYDKNNDKVAMEVL